MNYLDTYDISGSGAPAAPPPPAQQSLNEEVNEVLGQITSFWGGFTKQVRSLEFEILPEVSLRCTEQRGIGVSSEA